MHSGIEYSLAEIPTPIANNYIILESSSKGKFYTKNIHVLIPGSTKSEFKIGRGHESDIKVPEISVSRTHAKILMKEEGFVLEDNSSRFGTLVLVKDELKEIDCDDGLTVQIGRTIITFCIGQKECLGLEIQDSELTKTSKREVNNT
jgi:pSer/pThr/pTyr-binding forkhead associated (FHA) protein